MKKWQTQKLLRQVEICLIEEVLIEIEIANVDVNNVLHFC